MSARPALRIALVSEHASPLATLGGRDAGGQNVHVAALADGLGRLGADVTVYTRRDDPDLPTVVSLGERVRVVHIDAGPAEPIDKDLLLPHMAELGERLAATWSLTPPDVVHGHFWMSGRASLPAAHALRIPYLQTFHALGVVKRRHQAGRDTSPAERIAVESWLLAESDAVIATCTDEVFELARLGGPGRVHVVPCGVDTDHFTARGPVAPPRGEGQRLLVVSRLVERKGVGNVVSALAALPGVELLIAGGPRPEELDDDAEVGRLRAVAAEAGVSDRVHLLGRVSRDDLPALYRSADLAVCVPWYEPFGIVPLEAMACGRPVVASAVGGLIDTVVDGVTGLHVAPRDPAAVTEAVRALLADPAQRAVMGAAGAARARSRYSWRRVADRTLGVYAELLGVGARRETSEASSS